MLAVSLCSRGMLKSASRAHFSSSALALKHAPTVKCAIIGSGPAGFYTAYRLLEKLPDSHIDMYESLPVPFGLSRFGVAPDHPEVKNCQEKFEEVAESPRFRFIGNVTVGKDVSLETVKNNYNLMVLSYGSGYDRTLGVEGENLNGVFSAREFVGWYNGLPEFESLNPPLDQAEDISIIGNGNVALDVARILSCDPARLKPTDIAEHAYDALRKSTVKNIRIVGRRGLLQSAFTIKEIRELIREPGVNFSPLDPDYIHPYQTFIPLLARPKKRLFQLLEKIPAEMESKISSGQHFSRNVRLDYLQSPVKFSPNSSNSRLLSSARFEINSLVQDDIDSPATVLPTGEYISYPADLVFKSVGYKAYPLVGFEELGIPFDERRGLIPNQFGRVKDGVYVAGWVKNGPTGVIAETMRESFEVAETVIADYNDGLVNLELKPGFEAVSRQIQSQVVDWSDWKRLDDFEVMRGEQMSKTRSKFTSVKEMLEFLN